MERLSIAGEVAAKRCAPEDVLRFIEPGMDVVVGACSGEPVRVLDAMEAAFESIHDVRLHQMIPLRPVPTSMEPGLACGTCPGRGQAFIVLHSTAADDAVSRIVPQLHLGAAVTTFKNVVDKVVTEYGVAELRGSSIAERTRRLISIAHPSFREQLRADARKLGYLT